MALRSFPDNPPVVSRACRECGGRGTVWDWDADGTKHPVPCPGCQPNPVRAQMAREFGTDAQRRAIAQRTTR